MTSDELTDVLTNAREALDQSRCHCPDPSLREQPAYSCQRCQALVAFSPDMVRAIGEVVEAAQIAVDAKGFTTPVRRQLLQKRLAALAELLEKSRS